MWVIECTQNNVLDQGLSVWESGSRKKAESCELSAISVSLTNLLLFHSWSTTHSSFSRPPFHVSSVWLYVARTLPVTLFAGLLVSPENTPPKIYHNQRLIIPLALPLIQTNTFLSPRSEHKDTVLPIPIAWKKVIWSHCELLYAGCWVMVYSPKTFRRTC